jgi:virulence factor
MRARQASVQMAILKGAEFDTCEATGSSENYVYSSFQAQHLEFIDVVKQGTLPCSHFGDAAKSLEVAEIILAQAQLKGHTL